MGQDNKISGQGQSSAAAAPAVDHKALESQLVNVGSPEQCRAALSKIFRCADRRSRPAPPGKWTARFLFPIELATAGTIPISSSTAVAAHTAVTKKVELFNNFTRVKHASIFETVKSTGASGEELRPATIQKLMSAPVLDKKSAVMGVIQICHKGFDLNSAGADFTLDDLQKLEAAAKALAQVSFMRGNH